MHSKKTRLVLHGFFINYDMYNRAKIMFLDDYNYDEINSQNVLNNKLSFTKNYILKKSKKTNGKSPILDNNTCFNVNCMKTQIGYINNIPHPIKDLIQHQVEMCVEIKKYDFTKMGTHINGWNIKLIKMSLFER